MSFESMFVPGLYCERACDAGRCAPEPPDYRCCMDLDEDERNRTLQTMLKQGRVERVRRGVYVLPFTTEEDA